MNAETARIKRLYTAVWMRERRKRQQSPEERRKLRDRVRRVLRGIG